MGTYRNDYNRQEDEVLWELHEIRYELHKKIESTAIDELNQDAIKKFKNWRKSFKKRQTILACQ